MILKSVTVAGLALAVSGSILSTQPANAAAHNPLIVWQGGAEIITLNAACTKAAFSVGDLASSVFRPRLDPAEPTSAISLTFGRSAMAFFRQGGASNDQMQGTSNYSSPWYSGRVTSTPGGNTGTITLQITPASITENTDAITINGTVNNFFGLSGCTMTFRGAYRKRTN